jgi:hypothetical protein
VVEQSRQDPGGWRRLASVVAAVAVIAAACTSSGDSGAGPSDTVDLGGVELIAAMQRFDSCDAFLADVKAEALERVGPYGLGGRSYWGWPFPAGAELAVDDASIDRGFSSSATRISGDGGGSDPAFSGTNVQERGVDEPDIVKTDGRVMAVVSQQRLHLVDVTDPADPVSLSSTPLAGWGAELLLHGDRLLVLQQAGNGWDVTPTMRGAIGVPATTVAGDEAPGASSRIVPPYGPSDPLTTITQVDISDPGSPQVERTWTVEGSYISARLVGGVARIVLRSDPASTMPFVYPSGPAAEDAATAANRAVIEASTIDDWVATLTVAGTDGSIVGETTVAPCNQLYRPSVFSGFGMVSVLTADLGGSGLGTGEGVGVLSSGETVYASPTNLFVATNQWEATESEASDEQPIVPRPLGSQRTDVHQFSIEGSSPARYLASGSVEGYLLNQFSMSEHDGHLRIAVTEGQWDPQSHSSVVIMARRGEQLDEVGRVADLGRGEQIYAVRFMGDRGYVVTFRQIDPLYTLDLADPRSPRMVGELKIPGFSSYLHPVTDDLLVGVGQNATDEGRVLGSQMSLFDVSNPADPQRVALLELGSGTSSEVEYDHRAFLFWEGLAVLPYINYGWDTPEQSMDVGAIGVDIDAAARTLAERGRVTHADQPGGDGGQQSPDSPNFWDRQYGSQIRRSVVIGDTLLTVSDRGLLASDLASLAAGAWLNLAG